MMRELIKVEQVSWELSKEKKSAEMNKSVKQQGGTTKTEIKRFSLTDLWSLFCFEGLF